MDLALARAAVEGRDTATMLDLHRDGSRAGAAQSRRRDVGGYEARVKGQDSRSRAVTRRLALTRSNLDFAARAAQRRVPLRRTDRCGQDRTRPRNRAGGVRRRDALIRLDMSEYSDSWGVSRLTGRCPGMSPIPRLVDHQGGEPAAVCGAARRDREGAPSSWNVFLQVFDAGRLSDSRGVTADFRDAVVVMTSNIGVRESNRSPSGSECPRCGAFTRAWRWMR